jgi:hypothetical protein
MAGAAIWLPNLMIQRWFQVGPGGRASCEKMAPVPQPSQMVAMAFQVPGRLTVSLTK